MKISTKGRYAITAMMDLAIHEKMGPVTLSDISLCQGISLSYLEQIFARLRRSGLIKGTRGPRGGYWLARPAEQITMADIVLAINGSKKDLAADQENAGYHNGERCVTQKLWSQLSKRIYEFLDGVSLAEFTESPNVDELLRAATTAKDYRPRPSASTN